MPTGVYHITNTVNGKIYVGQAVDIYQRWRQHRHRLRCKNHDNRHLQASWNKHGSDKFDFSVVRECSQDELGRAESEELTKIPSALRFNHGEASDNPTLGMRRTREANLKQSRSRGGKPFFQKDLTTGVVTYFDFVSDVTTDKAHRNSITKALSKSYGREITVRGCTYWWDPDYERPSFEEKPKRVEKRNREVIGKHVETGEEISFAYVALVKSAGFTRTGVIKCLSGQMYKHKQHTWRYADGLPHMKMDEERKNKLLVGARPLGGSRAVVGTNLTTGQETEFPYAGAGALAVGVTRSFVYHCLAGNMKSAGGCTWRYADGQPHRPRKRQ